MAAVVTRAAPTTASDGLAVEGVTVAYPGGRALTDVSVGFGRGRVHVLAGENGAGKSTLIKLLTGGRRPDRGRVLLDGAAVHLGAPADAAAVGIRAVQQELSVFGHLRVWENIGAAALTRGAMRVDERQLRERARTALARTGAFIPIEAVVGTLAPASQQMVAIAAALDDRAEFLVLDEPTANLARPERARLLALISELADQGVGVIFVSHHLEEALQVGHDVTVLRDGEVVWTRERASTTHDQLVEAMFGGTPVAIEHRDVTRVGAADTPLLMAHGLRWGRGLRGLDLEVRAGEILGIAGLPGSDADSLNSAMAGGIPRRGRVMAGTRVLRPRLHASARDGAIGLVPADRKADGLFLDLDMAANIGASSMERLSRWGLITNAALVRLARSMIDRLGIQPGEPHRPIRTFSGGNQQKVLLGRYLGMGIRVLLADEPTRGVDIATKAEIHRLLRGFVDDGGACVIYSSDLHEIEAIADRVLVLGRDGGTRVAPPGTPAEDLFALMSEAA